MFNPVTRRSDREGLLSHGFQDVSENVLSLVRAQGHDAELVPVFYNSETRQWGNFDGRGLYRIEDTPKIGVVDNSPWYASTLGAVQAALQGWRPVLLAFSLGASSAAEGAVEVAADAATDTAATAATESLSESAMGWEDFGGVYSASGAEVIPAVDITTATGGFLDPWDMQPDPTIVYQDPSVIDVAGAGSGLPWDAITRNGVNLLTRLIGARRDVEVARAGASGAPSLLPQQQAFPANGLTRGSVAMNSGAPGSSGLNMQALILGAIAILFVVLFIRR